VTCCCFADFPAVSLAFVHRMIIPEIQPCHQKSELLSIMGSSSACAGGKYIEYRGFLSNHLSQYVTALTRLGASDEMIERAKSDYSAKLECRNGETASTQAAEEIAPVETLLGKRRSFYPLVSHYRQLLGSNMAKKSQNSGEKPISCLGCRSQLLCTPPSPTDWLWACCKLR